MNGKERIINTIKGIQTDRVPMCAFGTGYPEMERIKRYLGLKTIKEMTEYLGLDVYCHYNYYYEGDPKKNSNGKEVNYWGIPLEAAKHGNSSSLAPFCDVSTIKEVEMHNWPDPKDFNIDKMIQEVAPYSNDYAVVCGIHSPVFHTLTYLCGYENTMVYLYDRPEIMEVIIERITDFYINLCKRLFDKAKGKFHIFQNCNDFGAQDSLVMSPGMFRRYFKPALKRLYDMAKNYDMIIMQHSCGAIEPIIDDFIEMGADILNPIQPTAKGMEIEKLNLKYGKHITFCGGIDTQHILPEGTEEEVRLEVQRVLSIMAENGRYILAGSQGLIEDIPVTNIIAMFDEGKKGV